MTFQNKLLNYLVVGVVGVFLIALQAAPAHANSGTSKTKPSANKAASKITFPQAWEGIVKVEASSLSPNYLAPWNTGRPNSGTGTGWLVGKNRFMTNAHVVENATRLLIRLPSDPKPYEAKVLFVAHDADLAIIEPIDQAAFNHLKPFVLSGIPALNTEVIAVGYPIGGDRLSVTRGVVSRIDFNAYSHTMVDAHLTVQVDAAINPGNSGGPVLQNGKVVGVAFQGFNGATAQNVGYMIPVPVITRFLKDVEDGHYDHYVDLSINHFPIENPGQRKALGLPDDGLGVFISTVHSAGSSYPLVQNGDVLLSIDGLPIYSNGLIRLEGELVDLNEIVERKFKGDKVQLGLLRAGKKISVEIQLKRFTPMVSTGKQYLQQAPFVMYAGIVFQPLSRDLFEAYSMTDSVVHYYYREFLNSELYAEKPEVVILTSVLPDQINTHWSAYKQSVIDEINGMKIRRLSDVPVALAKKGNKPDFIELKIIGSNRPLVMSREQAQLAHPKIMAKYGIYLDQYLGE